MRHSNNYITTAHTECASEMLEIEAFRKVVKTINKENKFLEGRYSYPGKLPRYYVKLQGRGARTVNAINDGKHPRSYDQFLPLKYAEKVDVYVYTR